MLKDILFIAGKDLKYTLRARESVLWIFLMPIVFFYFIGTMIGGSGGGGSGPTTIAMMEDESSGFLADQLQLRLEEQDFVVTRTMDEEEFQLYRRRLRLPTAFTDSIVAGVPVKVIYADVSEGLSGQYYRMRASRAVYTLLADVLVTGSADSVINITGIEKLNSTERSLTLQVSAAGKRARIPDGFEHAIPGIMVMFTLLVMTTSGATMLVIERRQGLLRRLACTPISRNSLVIGKWLGKLAIGLVQIGFAMLAGTVIFKMDWGPDLPMVLALMFSYGALMASVGLVLGSALRNEGVTAAIGVITSNILAALGGCWWPIEITPEWMQKLQLFLPTGLAMDALHKLVSFGAGGASVVPHVLILSLLTLVLIGVSSRIFRYE